MVRQPDGGTVRDDGPMINVTTKAEVNFMGKSDVEVGLGVGGSSSRAAALREKEEEEEAHKVGHDEDPPT